MFTPKCFGFIEIAFGHAPPTLEGIHTARAKMARWVLGIYIYHMPSNVKSISAWSAVISTSALWHPHCRKLFDDKLSLYWRLIVTICRYMPRLNYMKRLRRWRHTVKNLPNSAMYGDICDICVVQNHFTRCTLAEIIKRFDHKYLHTSMIQ